MLSNTCKYGIRAVIYLAVHAGTEKKIGIKKISLALGIPAPFLGKILQTLARQKILSSNKGPHGGFGLGRKAEEISILDIVLTLDGNEIKNTCLIGLKKCMEVEKEENPCPLHYKYEKIHADIINLFREQNVAQLAKEVHDHEEIRI